MTHLYPLNSHSWWPTLIRERLWRKRNMLQLAGLIGVTIAVVFEILNR